jgi:hypothetical protein
VVSPGAEQGLAGDEVSAMLAEGELRKQRRAAPPSSPEFTSTDVPCSSSRACANCGITETAGSVALKPCSRCKAVVYCGKACQVQHWRARQRFKSSPSDAMESNPKHARCLKQDGSSMRISRAAELRMCSPQSAPDLKVVTKTNIWIHECVLTAMILYLGK